MNRERKGFNVTFLTSKLPQTTTVFWVLQPTFAADFFTFPGNQLLSGIPEINFLRGGAHRGTKMLDGWEPMRLRLLKEESAR